MATIPDEIKQAIEDEVQQAIKRGGEIYAGHYREGMEDGYSLAEKELEEKQSVINHQSKSLAEWGETKTQLELIIKGYKEQLEEKEKQFGVLRNQIYIRDSEIATLTTQKAEWVQTAIARQGEIEKLTNEIGYVKDCLQTQNGNVEYYKDRIEKLEGIMKVVFYATTPNSTEEQILIEYDKFLERNNLLPPSNPPLDPAI